jgi:hypothetical protein
LSGGRGRICTVRSIIRSGRVGDDLPVGLPVARKAVRRMVGVAEASVGGPRGPTGSVHCYRRRPQGEATVGSVREITDLRGEVGPFFCCGRSLSGKKGRSLTTLSMFPRFDLSLVTELTREFSEKVESRRFSCRSGSVGWEIPPKNLVYGR